MPIQSFACRETRAIFFQQRSGRLPNDVQVRALQKLLMLHAATDLTDSLSPPSNRLEKLHGNRRGQYSIRINKRWRICFTWRAGNAFDVEITDYH